MQQSLTWKQSTRTHWVLICTCKHNNSRRTSQITVAEVRRSKKRIRVNANGVRSVDTYYVTVLGNPFWFEDGFDDIDTARTAAVRDARMVVTQLAARMCQP